jgi:DNA-binding transcriptional LysR family regulator
MELRHLRYFIGVAEELHFARAAKRLGISQPPLSQQIAALEQELGVRLFERTSRSVTLTPTGAAFLDAARATLDQAQRAVLIARRAAQGELGQLSLGFNASAPFVPAIAKAIHDFRETFADVTLLLREVPGPSQQALLLDQTLDACFVRSVHPPRVDPAIKAIPVLRERLVVAMHAGHPYAVRETLTLTDLAGEPLLLHVRERGASFTDALLNMLRAAGVEPIVAHSVSEVSTLFGLAAAGLGITVLAESLCALQPAKLVYRPLSDPGSVTTMWLMHLRESQSPFCRNFLDIIAANTAGDAPLQVLSV